MTGRDPLPSMKGSPFSSGGASDDATAAAIAEVSMTKDGTLRVKMADKAGALAILARVHKLMSGGDGGQHAHLHLHKDRTGELPERRSSAREIIEARLKQIALRSGFNPEGLPAPQPVVLREGGEVR